MDQSIESGLAKALRSLSSQRIPFDEEQIPPDGSVFFIRGISPAPIGLTGCQILRLQEEHQLDSFGIKEFIRQEEASIEADLRAAVQLVGYEQLSAWTGERVCEYINDQFGRVHSIRHVTNIWKRVRDSFNRA